MSIDLRIPDSSVPTKRCFLIPQKLAAELDLYVEAAQQDNPDVTADLVLEAILEDRLKRDRGFRRWLKERAERAPEPVTEATPLAEKRAAQSA